MKKEFLIKKIQDPYKSMSKTYINLQKAAISAHHVLLKIAMELKILNYITFENYIVTLTNLKDSYKRESKKTFKMFGIKSSLKRKQILLCPNHHKD